MTVIPTIRLTGGMTSFRPFDWHVLWCHSYHLTDLLHDNHFDILTDVIPTIWMTFSMTFGPFDWPVAWHHSDCLTDLWYDGHPGRLTDQWHDIIQTFWLTCNWWSFRPFDWPVAWRNSDHLTDLQYDGHSAHLTDLWYDRHSDRETGEDVSGSGIQPIPGDPAQNGKPANQYTVWKKTAKRSTFFSVINFFSRRRWSPFLGVFSRFWWAEGATALARVDRLQQLLYKTPVVRPWERVTRTLGRSRSEHNCGIRTGTFD